MNADDQSRHLRSTTGLVRDPQDRVLGGVCAAVARRLDLDVTLIRLAMSLLVIVTGGAGLVVYLLAWMLIPQAVPRPDDRGTQDHSVGDHSAADVGTQVASPTPAPSARAAWRAVGNELRSLGAALRSEQVLGGQDPGAEGGSPPRRPLAAADARMTAFGQRLRAPEVQAGAKRTAAVLSDAIGTSIGEVGRRGRRS
jgi:phage shock protein PspC (stress-responsive transcriptional regulator)